jgi:cbb3-type cytochrome oxidase subunit 3
MNYSETNSSLLNVSHKPEKRNEVKIKPFDNKILTIFFTILLLAVVFSNIASDNQHAAQTSQYTSELTCNSDANRTGYALGCKLNNG